MELTSDGLVGAGGVSFPLISGVYRVASDENYSDSFGFQWNKFEKTQLDRERQNQEQSKARFFAVTKWNQEDLAGKNILEVGSGAGRFTQVVLQHSQANLYSVDYSNAVDANSRNNGPHSRLKLFQANIYQLPFAPAQFDKVFCFGVLQHTPDFKKSVSCLADMVKPGGELIVDFYPVRGWYTKIHAKYLLRPFTRRMSHEKLLVKIERNVDALMEFYFFFEKIGIGKFVNRFLPICDISRTIPPQLERKSLREWVVLDTFDMFSPAYDNPQPLSRVMVWFREFGLTYVIGSDINYSPTHVVTVVRGTRDTN